MRCIICNVKLKRIIPDPSARGGIRPCEVCEGISYHALLDTDKLYDESDVNEDIEQVVQTDQHLTNEREN